MVDPASPLLVEFGIALPIVLLLAYGIARVVRAVFGRRLALSLALMSIIAVLFFFHPDRRAELIGFLNEECRGPCVQSDLVFNRNVFENHSSYRTFLFFASKSCGLRRREIRRQRRYLMSLL